MGSLGHSRHAGPARLRPPGRGRRRPCGGGPTHALPRRRPDGSVVSTACCSPGAPTSTRPATASRHTIRPGGCVRSGTPPSSPCSPAALDADLPVLGVCRGMQLMAVHAGGRLVQHLPEVVGHERHRPELGTSTGTTPCGSSPPRSGPCPARRRAAGAVLPPPGRGRPGAADGERLGDDGTIEAVEDPAPPVRPRRPLAPGGRRRPPAVPGAGGRVPLMSGEASYSSSSP